MSSVDRYLNYDVHDFYMADTWDRANMEYATIDSLSSVINNVDALEGRIASSESSISYLNDAVATASANATSAADSIKSLSIGGVTLSTGFNELSERLDALSKKVEDLISGNGFGNSFLKLPSRIKRRDFKTLNR